MDYATITSEWPFAHRLQQISIRSTPRLSCSLVHLQGPSSHGVSMLRALIMTVPPWASTSAYAHRFTDDHAPGIASLIG